MKKDLFKNTIIIAIGKFGTQILSYFLLPLYTTILTTGEYGTYDLLITICIFLVPFITIMMEESMFRFLIDEKDDNGRRKVITTASIYAIISSIVWSLIIFIGMTLMNYRYTNVFILYLISSIIIKLINSISRGTSHIKLYSLSNFILSILTIVLNIVLIAGFRLGIYGLLYSTIISNLITSLFVFLKLKVYKLIKWQFFDKKKLKIMLKYSFPLVPNSISWDIINISDRVIVTSILGSEINGIYAMANKFPNIMNTFSSFFFTAFMENASIAIKKDNYEAYYSNIYSTIHNAFIGISLLLIAVIPFIFNLFIKKDFIASYNYIPLLIIALYYGNMAGFYGSLFTALKESKIIGKSTVIGAITNLGIHLLLIHYIGIYAAILSTFLANFIVCLYRKYKLRKFMHLHNIKNYYLSISMLVIISSLYYLNKPIVNIISLVIVLIYCFLSNQELLKDIKKLILQRVGK